jgi:hypothetical protein
MRGEIGKERPTTTCSYILSLATTQGRGKGRKSCEKPDERVQMELVGNVPVVPYDLIDGDEGMDWGEEVRQVRVRNNLVVYDFRIQKDAIGANVHC